MVDIIRTFYIKQNDLLPELRGQFLDATEQPIDLTGATLEFHMKRPADLVLGSAVIDGDPTLGRFRYAWSPGDTQVAGRFPFEIQATFSGGRPLTGPNKFHGTIVIYPEIA